MIELHQGDCIKVIDKLVQNNVKVDSIITDIPYGTTKCVWDIVIPFDEMWDAINSIKKDERTPILLFGQEPFSSFLRCSNLEQYKYDIYWQKERLTNVMQVKKRPGKVIENISVFYEKQCYYNPIMSKHEGKPVKNKIKDGSLGELIDGGNKKPVEYIDTGERYPLQIVRFVRDMHNKIHPTQKPVALMEYLVETYSEPFDIVLDFTMGSGTTGVACKKLNRYFIGIEKETEVFMNAYERIEEYDRTEKH